MLHLEHRHTYKRPKAKREKLRRCVVPAEDDGDHGEHFSSLKGGVDRGEERAESKAERRAHLGKQRRRRKKKVEHRFFLILFREGKERRQKALNIFSHLSLSISLLEVR